MTAVYLDFETFSLAGSSFDLKIQRFVSAAYAKNSTKKNIGLVGAYAYAAHPSAEVLVACYLFEDGGRVRKWLPNLDKSPARLLDHVKIGGSIIAMNSFFEWCVWNLVCVPKYEWPPLPIEQTRDAAAVARAWSLPGSLEKSTAALFGETRKNMEGNRVMLRLSQGRSPTKTDARLRYERAAPKTAKEAEMWRILDEYCAQDVLAEKSIVDNLPPLSFREFQVWLLDQRINARGIQIDTENVEACLKIVKEGKRRAGLKLAELTNGAVTEVSQATKLLAWINSECPTNYLKSLEPIVISEYLEMKNPPDHVKIALQIRRNYGGNATAKLVAMKYMSAPDGRVRGSYQYCGAKTRRWAGRGVQMQNMPNDGPKLLRCDSCGMFVKIAPKIRPCTCGGFSYISYEWGIAGIEKSLEALKILDYEAIEILYGNPLKIVSGCLRSLLIAASGYDLISSDYSAIEAVVMAGIAGESWIIDVFFDDGKLYEHTGSRIAGEPVEKILEHKRAQGSHHPARKLGKIASLASQYQGARGAWLKFGAGKFLTNDEIDKGVRDWRAAAPAIVHFWYACEQAAINAVTQENVKFPVNRKNGSFAGIYYIRQKRALYCVLPNNEWLTYVDPRIMYGKRMSADGWKILREYEAFKKSTNKEAGRLALEYVTQNYPGLYEKLLTASFLSAIRSIIQEYCFEYRSTLTYRGVSSQEGRAGKWSRIETYGGKLAENIIQATARFILSEAMLRLDNAGYSIIMHTHDEIISEVPENFGSLEEFERLMSVMPFWARLSDGRSWPIVAKGGWRGKRYRK